jgi:hypothetical protein
MEELLPISIETMGGMGNVFRDVIRRTADKIATRSNILYPEIINRIRTKITAILMKYNSNMMISSIAELSDET